MRVSEPLVEGEVYYYYHVAWKEAVPPGMYTVVAVAADEVGCIVAIRSAMNSSIDESACWGMFFNPPSRRRPKNPTPPPALDAEQLGAAADDSSAGASIDDSSSDAAPPLMLSSVEEEPQSEEVVYYERVGANRERGVEDWIDHGIEELVAAEDEQLLTPLNLLRPRAEPSQTRDAGSAAGEAAAQATAEERTPDAIKVTGNRRFSTTISTNIITIIIILSSSPSSSS